MLLSNSLYSTTFNTGLISSVRAGEASTTVVVQLREKHHFRLQVRNVSNPETEVAKESDRNSLKNLDAQLASRATSSSKESTSAPPPETSGESDSPRWTKPNAEDWPEFDGGFLVYTAGVLVVLTIFSNVFFNTIDKSLPGYKPKPPRTSTIVADMQRRRDEFQIVDQLRTEKRLAGLNKT